MYGLLSLKRSKEEQEQKLLLLQETQVAAQKEACKLRTRLQEVERAQRDTCRKLQERHRQVKGHPLACPGSTYPILLPSSRLTAILDISCFFFLNSCPFCGATLAGSPPLVRAVTNSKLPPTLQSTGNTLHKEESWGGGC